jgi:hypothetical protein
MYAINAGTLLMRSGKIINKLLRLNPKIQYAALAMIALYHSRKLFMLLNLL